MLPGFQFHPNAVQAIAGGKIDPEEIGIVQPWQGNERRFEPALVSIKKDQKGKEWDRPKGKQEQERSSIPDQSKACSGKEQGQDQENSRQGVKVQIKAS